MKPKSNEENKQLFKEVEQLRTALKKELHRKMSNDRQGQKKEPVAFFNIHEF